MASSSRSMWPTASCTAASKARKTRISSSRRRRASTSRRTSMPRGQRYVKLVVGDEERLLRVGEWSDWVPVELKLLPFEKLAGECRFYLKQLDPYFELYVSPINFDPLKPELPISTPAGLRGRTGPRHRPLLHAGDARRHERPEDRRPVGPGVPGAGAHRRRGKPPSVPVRARPVRRWACCSTTSATSTRCRT